MKEKTIECHRDKGTCVKEEDVTGSITWGVKGGGKGEVREERLGSKEVTVGL